MPYKLVVDSGCELIPELSQALPTETVPLTMTVGDQSFSDSAGLDVNDFLRRMNAYAGQSRSSCPAPGEYAKKFSGGDTTFAVTLSSRLSGSYDSAMNGKRIAEESGADVHVFDSKSASAGQLLIGLKIKEFIELGYNKSQIIQNIDRVIQNMKTFFVLENLENLVKNGRISKAVGHIASVLNFRAILGSDGDGNIAYFSKARGTKLAAEKLADMIGKYGRSFWNKTLVISHCNNYEHARRLMLLAKERYGFKNTYLAATRGLSSMYANNGGIIIAFD